MLLHTTQAIGSLESKLKQHASSEKSSGPDEKQKPSIPVDPQIYCILGHLNLLLENYPKGIINVHYSICSRIG